MSRKFNTKKFIKDVLNDRYALVVGSDIIINLKDKADGVHQRAASFLHCIPKTNFVKGYAVFP